MAESLLRGLGLQTIHLAQQVVLVGVEVELIELALLLVMHTSTLPEDLY
jgi:hypothetical protein